MTDQSMILYFDDALSRGAECCSTVSTPVSSTRDDELREIIRELWSRIARLEDEIAGRNLDRDDEDLD